jgi:hypothetical protein
MTYVDHFIVSNTCGDLFICDENGEYKGSITNSPSAVTKSQSHFIEVIIPTSKGFIVGGKNAQLFTYTYNPSNAFNPYELTQQLHVKSISEFKENVIKGIALTPLSEERIIVSLSSNLIYSLK